MPAFVGWILGGLVSIAGMLVGRVLISLGMSLVIYYGMGLLFDALEASIWNAMTSMAGTSPRLMQMLGILQVGTCFNIVISAVGVKYGMRALSGDQVKQWVHR